MARPTILHLIYADNVLDHKSKLTQKDILTKPLTTVQKTPQSKVLYF